MKHAKKLANVALSLILVLSFCPVAPSAALAEGSDAAGGSPEVSDLALTVAGDEGKGLSPQEGATCRSAPGATCRTP